MLFFIGMVAIASSLIGFVAVNYPETLQGFSMVAFWTAILFVGLYRTNKRNVDGNWLMRLVVIGLLLRLGMSFVHLAVAFWFYKGQLDLPGYHSTGVSVGREILQGVFRGVTIENLMAVLYFLVGPGIVGMVLLSGLIGFLAAIYFCVHLRLNSLTVRKIDVWDGAFFFYLRWPFGPFSWGKIHGSSSSWVGHVMH